MAARPTDGRTNRRTDRRPDRLETGRWTDRATNRPTDQTTDILTDRARRTRTGGLTEKDRRGPTDRRRPTDRRGPTDRPTDGQQSLDDDGPGGGYDKRFLHLFLPSAARRRYEYVGACPARVPVEFRTGPDLQTGRDGTLLNSATGPSVGCRGGGGRASESLTGDGADRLQGGGWGGGGPSLADSNRRCSVMASHALCQDTRFSQLQAISPTPVCLLFRSLLWAGKMYSLLRYSGRWKVGRLDILVA